MCQYLFLLFTFIFLHNPPKERPLHVYLHVWTPQPSCPSTIYFLCKSLPLDHLSFIRCPHMWLAVLTQEYKPEEVYAASGRRLALCGLQSLRFCINRVYHRSWALSTHVPFTPQNPHPLRKHTARGGPEWDPPKCRYQGRILSSLGLESTGLKVLGWWLALSMAYTIHEGKVGSVLFLLSLYDPTRFWNVCWVGSNWTKIHSVGRRVLKLLPAYCMSVTKLSVLYMFPYSVLKNFEKDIKDSKSTFQVE